MIARIVAAVEVPVSADLEAGYGDAGETVRRAIEVGVVGANLEDQLKPLPEALRAVEKAVAAAEAEAVPFALNARTDAFVRAGDRDRGEVLADAIERGRAYLDAGATCFFVPGLLQDAEAQALVAALGRQRVSVIGVPGSQSPARFEEPRPRADLLRAVDAAGRPDGTAADGRDALRRRRAARGRGR